MKVRTTIAGTALRARLTALCWGALTLLAPVAVTACSGSSTTPTVPTFTPSVSISGTATGSGTAPASGGNTPSSGTTTTTSSAAPSVSSSSATATATATAGHSYGHSYGHRDGRGHAHRDENGHRPGHLVKQRNPDCRPGHRRRGHGRLAGRAALRARRGGDPGRHREHRLPQATHQAPLTPAGPAGTLRRQRRRLPGRPGRHPGGRAHPQPGGYICGFAALFALIAYGLGRMRARCSVGGSGRGALRLGGRPGGGRS